VEARTSETSVDNYFTRQYIPEDNSELHEKGMFVTVLALALTKEENALDKKEVQEVTYT
jgi:hypothetical protein